MSSTTGTLIGDDLREATDWLQDRLETTRPVAEGAMVGLLRAGTARTTAEGIVLTESEEEAERQARNTNSKQGFRNHNRSKSRIVKKKIGPDISQAERMIQADKNDEI